ncbi:MAG: SIS domain-containing protein, partial [Acidobacteria bacterium]|nr:SIS domain-containing protein [Acidobacteriota bacterium]
MANAATDYFDRTIALLRNIRETQMERLEEAAAICARSIGEGGLVFLFGNGHSRMMCEEMTPRQGCYVGWVALVELALSNHANIVGTNGLRAPLHLEKYEGYA